MRETPLLNRRGGRAVDGLMLLAALVLALAAPPPAPATPPTQNPNNTQRAECLRQCAGAPKDATGKKLMACLQACETKPDAGS